MNAGGVTGFGLAVLVGVSLGAGINFWIAAAADRRNEPVARVYRWLALATAMLCVASVGMYLGPTPTTVFGAYALYSLFNVSGAALFVLFTVVYTGNRDWLTRRRVALLAVEPAAYLLLLVTNPLHGLVLVDVHVVPFEGLATLRAQPTALTAVHILYTLVLTTTGYALFVRFYFRARNVYRTQTGVIFLSSLLIPTGAFLYAGGVTPVDLTPFALVVNGVVVWVALFRYDFLDVTPLAADLLIEEMEDSVVVTGPNGRILDVNGAAGGLLASGRGSASSESPVGRSLADVSPSLVEAADGGELFVRSTGDGAHARIFDPSVTTIRDQFDIERGTLLVLRDVTEQVRRREELERQNERLDEFVSVVSHDLRNPLAIAEGYVDLARGERDSAHLDRAADAVERMNVLVEDLLTLARDGRSVDEVERVSLASVVDEAWQNVDGDATLVNEAEGTVEADARRLQQMFENLFRNSVEHSSTSSRAKPDDAVEHGARQASGRSAPGNSVEHGSASSETTSRDVGERAEPGVTIRVGCEGDGFFVEDDGPGIPAADRDRVFEHGYTSSASGTGFGLAIVRTIAEAHGWSVRSVEGRDGGARFEFSGVTPFRPVDAR
ncbi:ATP-binding protein [Halogeometricum sp. S1BR25-6]|uniref:histidine kinase n=1 Tax=Halogeometricum salsisoli TaxID=2950536 RepID=A0ABU2GFD0_9EURY|nr:histidine kinase N-terminal 7TM domain-containing protein [Halogeometricum sp. S1BR25-6]MDS0299490.1 ATP-binding protein [Halogeometricum sp. S1BR25-6]